MANYQGNITLGSSWTIEGCMRGFGSNADTGGNSVGGLLDPNSRSSMPVAGIEMHNGSNPLVSYFLWPGGSYNIPGNG